VHSAVDFYFVARKAEVNVFARDELR
jgi:hypothetical protein